MGCRMRKARTRHASLFSTILVAEPVAGGASAAPAAGLDDEADQWLPRSDGAEWVYAWSNSDYSAGAATRAVRLQARRGTAFRLRWDEVGPATYDTPGRRARSTSSTPTPGW